MNFGQIIQKDLQNEANEQRVKLSVVLTGDPARVFQELHRALNAEQGISAGQLAARLLGLALIHHDEPRRRRSRALEMGDNAVKESR
jgi:hypothetical protein